MDKALKHLEKKYRVTSLSKIQKILDVLGAQKVKQTVATHYYARHKGNGVVKLVAYEDKNEIHVLEDLNGKFSLKETVPMKTTEAGLQWLKDKGHTMVDIVKMANTDYTYEAGVVGLYLINDSLRSIILDFPEGQHETIEKELGLDSAETIDIPYNKLLERLGKLQTIDLSRNPPLLFEGESRG